MQIDRNETIGRFAARHPEVTGLLEKWDVDFKGKSELSVAEVCSSIGITIAEFTYCVDDICRRQRIESAIVHH